MKLRAQWVGLTANQTLAEEGNSEPEVGSEEVTQNVACTDGIEMTLERIRDIGQSEKI